MIRTEDLSTHLFDHASVYISDLTRFCYRDDISPNAHGAVKNSRRTLDAYFRFYIAHSTVRENCDCCIRNNACLVELGYVARYMHLSHLKKDRSRSSFGKSVDCFASKFLRLRVEYISLGARWAKLLVNMMKVHVCIQSAFPANV